MTSKSNVVSPKNSLMAVAFTLALIIMASSFVFISVKAAAPVFTPAINLSNDAGVAKDATISNNGQNVYAAWTEGSKGIMFRMSPDGGITWMPPTSSPALRLSPKGGVANFPVMYTQFQGTKIRGRVRHVVADGNSEQWIQSPSSICRCQLEQRNIFCCNAAQPQFYPQPDYPRSCCSRWPRLCRMVFRAERD